MLFDHCRAQADTAAGDVVPMDLAMLGKGKGNANAKNDQARSWILSYLQGPGTCAEGLLVDADHASCEHHDRTIKSLGC